MFHVHVQKTEDYKLQNKHRKCGTTTRATFVYENVLYK